jgi:hypothetical protein
VIAAIVLVPLLYTGHIITLHMYLVVKPDGTWALGNWERVNKTEVRRRGEKNIQKINK